MASKRLNRSPSPSTADSDGSVGDVADIVNFIAVVMIAFAALGAVFYLFIVPSNRLLSLTLMLVVFMQGVVVRYLVRRQQVRRAVMLLVAMACAGPTLLVITEGTLQTINTVGYMIAIVFAILALGDGAGRLTTLVVFLITFIVTILEGAGAFAETRTPQPPFAAWFNFVVLTATLSVSLSLFRKYLAQALAAARRNEQALSQRNLELQQEIKERMQAEVRLARQAALLSETERIAKIGSWAWDIAENRVVWSDEIYRLHGVDPLSYVPSYAGFLDIIHPDDRDRVHAAVTQTLQTGTPYRVEFRQLHPGGSTHVFLAEGKLERNATGAAVRLVGFLHDITERRRAEDAIRKNEERFRSLFENSPISLWEEDFTDVKAYLDHLQAQGVSDLPRYLEEHPEAIATAVSKIKILSVNQATLWLYGAKTKEELPNVLSKVFMDSNAHVFKEELLAYWRGQAISRGEQTILTVDGRALDTVVTSTIVAGYEQTWARVIVSVMDISARKQAEAALVKQVERTLTMSEIVASLAHLDHSSFETNIHQALEVVAMFANAQRASIYLVDADAQGATLVNQWYAYPQHTPAPLSLSAGSSTPPTLHRLPTQIVLKDAALLLAALQRDIVIDANSGSLTATAEDRSFQEIAAHLGAVSAVYIPLTITEQLVGWISFDTVKGSVMWSEEAMHLFAFTGQIIAATLDRKRSGDALRQLNADLELRIEQRTEQLQAANHELESFAYSVSHDLRAPLRSIDGFSQALLEDYHAVLDETGRNYLHRVRAATQRMDRLISDLLQLSRVTRQEIRAQFVDLSAIVNTIVAELQDLHPNRQVEVVITPKLMATCDPGLLKVALENLLGNAWKFTGKHERARIEFGATQQAGRTVYFVRDDGAGFDPDYAEKLFGAFQRLHRPDEFEGTGIGLATVQRIIRRHGGRIWAEGQVEKGAAFYFTL